MQNSKYEVLKDALGSELAERIELPEGFVVLDESPRGTLAIERPDGLKVFVNPTDPKELNMIRLNPNIDKETIIKVVAAFRGLQIGLSYARSHAPELVDSFKEEIRAITAKLANENALEEGGGA